MRRLIALISTEGKSTKQIVSETHAAFRKFRRVNKKTDWKVVFSKIKDKLLKLGRDKLKMQPEGSNQAKYTIFVDDNFHYQDTDERYKLGTYRTLDEAIKVCKKNVVFVERDERGWLLAYSEKSLTSLEAMLLDRYRSYLWIHFHHKAVAMKTLGRFLIEQLLDRELITPEHFKPSDPRTLLTHDDIWLWSLIRNLTSDDPFVEIAKEAVLERKKDNVLNLWKGRIEYHALDEQIKKMARITSTEGRPLPPGFYERHMGEVLNAHVLEHDLRRFEPIGDKAICLYSEREQKLTSNLQDVSELVDSLEHIWKDEPPRYLLLLGDNIATERTRKQQEWVDAEARLRRG
jgi:hypothetical protein